jgi:regulator of protease activity HflC (stomatin/prohibitin superfamily)
MSKIHRFIPNAVPACALAFLVLGPVGCTNPHTPAGHEGYVYEDPRVLGQGGFRGTVHGPGNYGLSLFRNRVVNVDTRPSTYSEEFQILVKDDLNVQFRVHAVMSVDPQKTRDVVENYGGGDWYPRYIKEPYRTIVRQAAQEYTSLELKAERETIASLIETKLVAYLDDTPFQIERLAVGNIDYPQVVSKAVEKKLAAAQLLEEKSTQREIAQRDAEIRVEEAKGIAEAQKIINATLTANYLQHEAIEAQRLMANSPNHTTVYIPVGSNGLPLVHEPGN